MKLARYGKLIEATDTRIRDHMDHTEVNERSILQKLTFEKESLIDELKSERKTFNATIADAVRELKIAQQIQKDQQNRFLEAQREIIALTEQHQPVVVQQPILRKSPEPQEPCKSCKDLEAEIKSLKLEIEKVSKEAAESAKQLLAEKESNATLTDHIAEIQTLTQTQSDTIQCLTSASSELEMHLKESILSIESLSMKKEKSDSVAKKLSEENQSLRDDLEHLETTLQRKKIWISENKRHIDDYRTSLSAAGLLDLMKVKVGGKTQGLSHCTLEDFIISTLKEIHDLRKQLQRYQALESEQAFQLESYKEELSKQNEVIAMSKVHLESSVAIAEGLRSERDYAISKIKDTVKVCKSRENQFQMELEIREKGVLEVVETSNQNLKAVREGYEVERAKFKEEIKDLLRENMALEANLRAVTKDNKLDV
ncbi:hypothetical protein BCR33DRAFT_225208 [Rhizoclosmatium globosum]|uniref:Uncharacterized protein n=1 Tax=Rhizoclosmatium globosum TaxID=329046 RepID=A0A1Y2CBX8_9FUNG|nr:hypothetical protein BCR33DRAFT_225208 [Rhizoclosmatium globosum]|eukprot:ORY44539.1 hypothetical protein BCR33DRAFT_225208 [Rhizoclosmatium globosum]